MPVLRSRAHQDRSGDRCAEGGRPGAAVDHPDVRAGAGRGDEPGQLEFHHDDEDDREWRSPGDADRGDGHRAPARIRRARSATGTSSTGPARGSSRSSRAAPQAIRTRRRIGPSSTRWRRRSSSVARAVHPAQARRGSASRALSACPGRGASNVRGQPAGRARTDTPVGKAGTGLVHCARPGFRQLRK